jgi:hypothetical protein
VGKLFNMAMHALMSVAASFIQRRRPPLSNRVLLAFEFEAGLQPTISCVRLFHPHLPERISTDYVPIGA